MCRLAAYYGAPVGLDELIYRAPHGLERQAYLPAEMVSGHVNVDGTGVAWWEGDNPQPMRYVTESPPWSDANLPGLSTRLQGAPQLAVVRSQTPGMAAGAGAVHPFVHGAVAGTHNGYLGAFDVVAPLLIAEIDASLIAELGTVTDARLLFLMAITRIDRGASLGDAIVDVASTAARACVAADAVASLNLVLARRDEIVAVRCARGVPPNSMYTLERGQRWPGGLVLASEALDDDSGWLPVGEDQRVTLSAEGIRSEPVRL